MPFIIDRPLTPEEVNLGAAMSAENPRNDTPTEESSIEELRARQIAERAERLKAKNRRKRYLEMHPEYFGKDLELSDPVLYDRLIRRFMTAAEREAEGQARNLSDVITMDHIRSEAREEALQNPSPFSLFTCARGPDGELLPEEPDEIPRSKEEGRDWWVDEMTQRFLRGDNKYFDYKTVDNNPRYDDPEEERDIEDAYFESMEPYLSDPERELEGETGIQDY